MTLLMIEPMFLCSFIRYVPSSEKAMDFFKHAPLSQDNLLDIVPSMEPKISGGCPRRKDMLRAAFLCTQIIFLMDTLDSDHSTSFV